MPLYYVFVSKLDRTVTLLSPTPHKFRYFYPCGGLCSFPRSSRRLSVLNVITMSNLTTGKKKERKEKDRVQALRGVRPHAHFS
ncbi:hypothetical protein BGW80DRAFT_1309012 [Lactifluus volemus]|nr:hypothetical protein BGW80DRAFT_1309012 [Lactifluus volemus]